MKLPEKKQRWVYHAEALPQAAGEGVTRRVLAYTDGLMCVENTFEKGAVGALHHHPPHPDYLCGVGCVRVHGGRRDPHCEGRGYHPERRRRGARLCLHRGRHPAGHLHPHAGGFCLK